MIEKIPSCFWFHGGTGGVEAYQPFAKRVSDLLRHTGKRFDRERAAARNRRDYRLYENHPSGTAESTYDLGGYSLGGMLAYETARLLQEEGHTVKAPS